MAEDFSDEATKDELDLHLAGTDLPPPAACPGCGGERGAKYPIPTGESAVCKFSRIVAPTPSRFPQHKGLFLRSASFAGIVCIVPGELRANNFTFSTRDASGTVHIAFAELLFLPRALTGIVCIVPVQLWALFILQHTIAFVHFCNWLLFSGLLPLPRVPCQNPSKSSKATIPSDTGCQSMLLVFSSAI